MNALVPFTKMVAAGNDFLLVDTLHHRLGSVASAWPKVARASCDRRYGVGADGLLVLEPTSAADVRMRVFNPDGSEAAMCGNGARCVAWYVRSQVVEGGRWKVEGNRQDVILETAGGLIRAQVIGDRVRIRMPDPRGVRLRVPLAVDPRIRWLAFLDTGVPHVVAMVNRLETLDVEQVGRTLRFHRAFQPNGANVNFIEARANTPNRLRIRTYERGVEGETLACGTGVTAAAVVQALNGNGAAGRAHKTPRSRRLVVETRSGETLTVSLMVLARGETPTATNVVLEGTVQWVCDGTCAWSRRGATR